MDEERLSRWAAGITAGFFVIIWPSIVALTRLWDCAAACKTAHGRAIVLGGVVGLILVPLSALVLIFGRRIATKPLAAVTIGVAALLLIGAIAAWAAAGGALVDDANVWVSLGNSLVVAGVMAVYCAAVAGGSWMSAIGIGRLERDR